MDELAARLAGEPGLAEQHASALDRFLTLGGGDLDARARTVCAELGLHVPLDAPLGALSGGEAARAQLAAILLARFDVFLLDEPTNDLDFAGLERLEEFLTALPGAVVVVSHDRDFLDRTAERIVELDEWTHRAAEFAGSWSDYEEARGHALRRQSEAYAVHEGEKARLVEQMRRMQRWEERGYGQGRKKKKTKDVKSAIGGRIARDALDLQERGISVTAVMPKDAPEPMKRFAKEHDSPSITWSTRLRRWRGPTTRSAVLTSSACMGLSMSSSECGCRTPSWANVSTEAGWRLGARRSEGSSPSSADHRATSLYSVDRCESGP